MVRSNAVIVVRPKDDITPFLGSHAPNVVWVANRSDAQRFVTEHDAKTALGKILRDEFGGDVPVGGSMQDFLIDPVDHPEVEEAYIFCQARDFSYLPVLVEYAARAGHKSLGAICGRAVANNISDLIEEMVERSKNK